MWVKVEFEGKVEEVTDERWNYPNSATSTKLSEHLTSVDSLIIYQMSVNLRKKWESEGQ